MELPPNEYKIVRVWDDKWAEHTYQLKVTKYERYEAPGAYGNRAWAERQAEHYGIEIEESE